MFNFLNITFFIIIFIILYFINCRVLYADKNIIEIGKNLNYPFLVDYSSNKNLYQNYDSVNNGLSFTYFYNVFQDLYLGFEIDVNNKAQYNYLNTYTTPITSEENKITYKINKLGSLNIRYAVYSTDQLKIYLGTFVSLFQQKLDIENSFSEIKALPENIVEDTEFNKENSEISLEFAHNDFSSCTAGYYASPDLNIAINTVTNTAFITRGYIICSTNHTVYVDKVFNYKDHKNVTELQYYIGFDVTTSYTLYKNVALGLSVGVTNVSKFTIPDVKYSDIQATFYTNSLYTKVFLSFHF